MFSVVFSEVSGSDIILVNDDVSVQLHNRHVHSYIDMENLDTQNTYLTLYMVPPVDNEYRRSRRYMHTDCIDLLFLCKHH